MNHSLSKTYEEVCEVLFFSNFFFLANMSDNKDKNNFGNASEEIDLKFLMEALMGEMRRVLRAEMKQVHKRIDQLENPCVE